MPDERSEHTKSERAIHISCSVFYGTDATDLCKLSNHRSPTGGIGLYYWFPFMRQLTIENLYVTIADQEIVRGLSLTVPRGEVHAIMGPNGSGKSTLAKLLAGHPDYHVTRGKVTMDGENLLELEPDERARRGLFMAFQYPSEIPGVTIANFLRAAVQARLPDRKSVV